jgi:signal transduction histidine kinase
MPQADDAELYPPWLVVMSLFPLVCGVAVVVQRWNQPNLGWTIFLVALAVVPLTAADVFTDRVGWFGRIPPIVLAIPVLVAVGVLIWTPVNVDIAPFLLFLVTVRAAVAGTFVEGLIVAAASIAVMLVAEFADAFDGSFVWVLGISLAWAGGAAFKAMFVLATRLKDAQADLAERAAADERQRIARELHDVIAHSLSVSSLHITGARMALKRDRADAEHALEEAERLTRDSLSQVRSIIGILAPETDGTAPAMPTASDIPALIGEYASAGLAVDMNIDGDLARLSPAVGLSLYRVTQESLSNVVRHAPGHAACVRIVASDDVVRLTVTNDAGAAVTGNGTSGRGLLGMRDRAAAHAGTLDVGPVGEQWRVELTIPASAAS